MNTSEYVQVLLPNQNDTLFLRPIEHLNLSRRSCNCLKSQNIFHIRDLVQCTKNDLMRTPNLGRRSLREIELSLDEIGLALGMNAPSIQPVSDIEENALRTMPTSFAPPQITLSPTQRETPPAQGGIPSSIS